MPIHRRREVEGVGDIYVEALSPSAATFNAAAGQVAKLIEALLSEEPTGTPGLGGLHPNDLSVAIWVRAGDRHILLGADLENKGAAKGHGWQAVIDLGSQRDAGGEAFAEVAKVPHHGSRNANDPMRWAELAVVDLVGIVAPWMVGGDFLPDADDLVSLAERCSRLWVAAEVPVLPSSEDDTEPAPSACEIGGIRSASGGRPGRPRLDGNIGWKRLLL